MSTTEIQSTEPAVGSPPAARAAGAGAGAGGGGEAPPPVAAKNEPPWGAIVVITGLFAIVTVFVVAVLHYKAAADVATAVGTVSGVVAALVGAYFGIRGAILAQTNAEPGPSNAKV